MLIGIDFDNTIAGYDDIFVAVAIEMGFLERGRASDKTGVREALIGQPGGEQNWMRVQGRVYGANIDGAVLIDGISEFLVACTAKALPVCIVSHKTEFGHFDEDRVNLRDAAMTWMRNRGFFDPNGFALAPDDVYFESTRQAKVKRIAALGCTHFVDDLIEVFDEPNFPENTRRYLFNANADALPESGAMACRSWQAIGSQILDEGTGDE